MSVYDAATEEAKQCVIDDMRGRDTEGEDLYVYLHPTKALFCLALSGKVGLRSKLKDIVAECFGEDFDKRNHISEITVEDGVVTIAYLQPLSGRFLERWEAIAGAVMDRRMKVGCPFDINIDAFNVLPLCEFTAKGGETDNNKVILPPMAFDGPDLEQKLQKCTNELMLPPSVQAYIDYTVFDKFKGVNVRTEADGSTVVEQAGAGEEAESGFCSQLLRFFKDTEKMWGAARPRKKSDLQELFRTVGLTEEYMKPEDAEEAVSPLDLAFTVLSDTVPNDSKKTLELDFEDEEDLGKLLEMNTDELFFYAWMR